MKNLRNISIVMISLVILTAVGLGSGLIGRPVLAEAALDEEAVAGTGTVGTAFTFQGRLQKGDEPFSGQCAMQFSLWDAATGGVQQGNTLPLDPVSVEQGLFAVTLDFGDQFKGDARWLETAVKCPGDAGYTKLEPRQSLLAVPYALSLRPDSTVSSATGNGLRGIANAEGRGGLVGLHTGKGGYGVYGNSPNGGGVVGISDSWIGVYGETKAAAGTGAAGVFGKAKGTAGMAVAGKADAAGSIGVKGTANEKDSYGVWGESQQYTGVYGLSRDWAGVWGKSTNASGIYGETTAEFGAGVFGENKGKGYGVKGVAVNSAGVYGKSTNWTGVYGETAKAGIPAIWGHNTAPGGKAARFDGTVEITSGADLAELFTISGETAVEPGTLLVIDPANPGQLLPSTEAYDTRVAGIASGAGGVRPGLTLHQEGLLEGKTEVAIAGRVYVRAEADSASIEPGDLLTSSAVPGLAMKAADHDQAYGAVIGKALTGLEEGQGLVLVLVNLQ